jgi:DNA-binding MarR family transcriptional regulator
MKIEEAIQQKKFKNEFLKADINIMYTASWLSLLKRQLLNDFDISWQQFNILRILKGQFPNTSPLKELSERMIDKTSNTSRLVDKLVDKGLVERNLCPRDRRRVDIVISKAGLDMIDEVSPVIEEGMSEVLARITEDEARMLNTILDKIRTE